ncbi:hypothetical protein QO002_001718 [Pararhizobium capsulatum DSM 1112]|uniref:DUF5330 domain-containing protein n=1 Tax=Pararhizobium capsulatum DSM 1112 TaxID=1121113 RepID=A0ABU0BQ29_9HYPH|nr:DUF5330 domain-containing protein [Pararhizobium capsulatum]MDQ0319580.1 hypothetical protein [Pararhizobium capsulatum DSM 1112]
MWFLIKGTFWFSLVLVLLPFLDTTSTKTLENGPKVNVGDTVSAATEAFTYISAICVQKPDVCEKGAETFVALGHRAREGARIAYQFLDTQFAEPGDAVMTGTITDPVAKVITENPIEAAPAKYVTIDPAADAATTEAEAADAPFMRIPVPEKRIEPRAQPAG